MEPLLSVRDLSVSFTRYDRKGHPEIIRPVRQLGLDLYRGEIVAVVGASGSGKSLLAHAILGLLPYNATQGGTMYYEGEALTPERIERLRGRSLALIPQSVSYLDPLMTVGEQVLGESGDPAKREAVYETLGLGPEVNDLFPFQLSGGMARRVLVATALVNDAPCIIADEPTPGMDPKSAVAALQCLRDMANAGKGVILITHDIDLAVGVADRIVVFYDGRVVDTVTVRDIAIDGTGITHPYTKALFAALPQASFQLTSPAAVDEMIREEDAHAHC